MSAPPPPPQDEPPVAGAEPPDDLLALLNRVQADLPEDQKTAIGEIPPSVLRAIMIQARSFSGPLPPPQILREYESILPGSAARIFQMAETQQAHRVSLEALAVPAGERRADRGQLYALAVSLAGFVVSGLAVVRGMEVAAVAIGGADLAVLAGLFVLGRESIARSLRRKREGQAM